MGIRRIVFLFDVDKFRATFEPFIQQIEEENYVELRGRIQEINNRNSILWPVLEDIGYYKDDLGNEDKEFDRLGCLKFWILVLLSSFCKSLDFAPVDARSTRELLDVLNVDKETTLKLTWGKPFGHLLMRNLEDRFDLDGNLERNDAMWPYWCRSYGSLGWLSASEIQPLLKTLNGLSLADLNLKEQSDYQLLLNTLDSAMENGKGLLLGVSA